METDAFLAAIKTRDFPAINGLIHAGVDHKAALRRAASLGDTEVWDAFQAVVESEAAKVRNELLLHASEAGFLYAMQDLMDLGAEASGDLCHPSFAFDRMTPLHSAAVGGSVGALELLLATEEVSPRSINEAVWIAAARGNVDVLLVLLHHGGDPCVKDLDDTPAVWMAAQRGSVAAIKMLVGAGANPESAVGGMTPLWIAAQMDHMEVAAFLVEGCGVCVDSPDYVGAKNNNLDMVRYLLAHGACVNAARDGGATAITVAAHDGHPVLARTLLDAGADPTLVLTADGDFNAVVYAVAHQRLGVCAVLAAYGFLGQDATSPTPVAAVVGAVANHGQNFKAWLQETRQFVGVGLVSRWDRETPTFDAVMDTLGALSGAIARSRLEGLWLLTGAWEARDAGTTLDGLASLLSMRRLSRPRPGTKELLEPFGQAVVAFL